MNIWTGFGGEHSAKLRIVGRFESVADADKARRVLETLASVDSKLADQVEKLGHLTPELREALRGVGYHQGSADQVSHLQYDHRLTQEGPELTVRTDEITVDSFAIPMLSFGAEVTVRSEHESKAAGALI